MGGHLTANELLTELSSVQDSFKWSLTGKGRIRGCLKNDGDQRLFDPVTAVVYFRTGEFFSEGHWTKAAEAIGLEYSACAEIIAAANYEWDPSCPQGALRRRLLHNLIPEIELKETERESSSLANVFLRDSRKRSPNTH